MEQQSVGFVCGWSDQLAVCGPNHGREILHVLTSMTAGAVDVVVAATHAAGVEAGTVVGGPGAHLVNATGLVLLLQTRTGRLANHE